MKILKAGLRPAFGLLLLGHSFAHAVLPLRGWMTPERLPQDFMPMILYAVSVLGFTIAALGIFRVTPFVAMTRPAMVVASPYSLVALSVMDSVGLVWGSVIDLAALLVGLSGTYRYLPEPRPTRHPVWHACVASVGLAFVLDAASAVVLWPLHRRWGSLHSEHALALPGDAPARDSALELQHAVTIDAPPEQVWPWLVQLGQDRAGFYSYDWLERAFGVRVYNATEIRPEWQMRQAGDRVRATQDGYLGGILGNDLGWTVKELHPGRAMVLQHWGAFVLLPTEDGKTRFIIRTKVGDPAIPAWAAPLDMIAFEVPHFIMERKMMLQIKALAEKHSGDGVAMLH